MHKIELIIGLDKVTVRVSGFDTPMNEHHLEKIELLLNGRVIKEKSLKEGDLPYADFQTSDLPLKDIQNLKARAYCNKHGVIE